MSLEYAQLLSTLIHYMHRRTTLFFYSFEQHPRFRNPGKCGRYVELLTSLKSVMLTEFENILPYIYRLTHIYHPSSRLIQRFNLCPDPSLYGDIIAWLIQVCEALNMEYKLRYDKEQDIKSIQVVRNIKNFLKESPLFSMKVYHKGLPRSYFEDGTSISNLNSTTFSYTEFVYGKLSVPAEFLDIHTFKVKDIFVGPTGRTALPEEDHFASLMYNLEELLTEFYRLSNVKTLLSKSEDTGNPVPLRPYGFWNLNIGNVSWDYLTYRSHNIIQEGIYRPEDMAKPPFVSQSKFIGHYRSLYMTHKRHIASWKKVGPPHWYV